MLRYKSSRKVITLRETSSWSEPKGQRQGGRISSADRVPNRARLQLASLLNLPVRSTKSSSVKAEQAMLPRRILGEEGKDKSRRGVCCPWTSRPSFCTSLCWGRAIGLVRQLPALKAGWYSQTNGRTLLLRRLLWVPSRGSAMKDSSKSPNVVLNHVRGMRAAESSLRAGGPRQDQTSERSICVAFREMTLSILDIVKSHKTLRQLRRHQKDNSQ